MAWKTITLYGCWVSFERDSDWWVRHKEVSGFSSIEKIEVEGVDTLYKESDFASVDIEQIVSIYPTKTYGLKKCKRKECFTLKINASTFDPNKLQLHYANVVIKIGNEMINTGNQIIDKITYNGRKCNLKWESSNDQEFETIIWHKSPFIYNWCGSPDEGFIEAELNGWWGYVNSKGCVSIPFQFYNAEKFHDGLAAVELDNRLCGFIDKTGREVIPCEYDEVHDFKEGLALFYNEEKRRYGFIDKSGKEVIPCVNEPFSDGFGWEYHDFSCGVAVAFDRWYFSYIDKKGKTITPMTYSYAKPFSEGLGAVRSKGKWGFIDATGATIIPLMYSEVCPFSEGFAAVRIGEKWGYIDKSNNMVIPCKFDDAYNFNNGLAIVKKNGKVGFIDKAGRDVIKCKYSDAWDFSNGLAPVKKNRRWGYINLKDTLVIPFEYDKAEYFHKNGLACVRLNDKMGCIDKQGHIVVPLIYDCIGNHEEVLTAKLYEKWGLLDLQGNYVEDNTVYKSLSSKYDQVFINNGEVKTYSIALDGKYGLADCGGNELISPRYDWLGDGFYDGLCLAGYRGENPGVGYINLKGEEVIAPKRWTVTDFKNGTALVSFVSQKWGAINTCGKLIVPCEYNEWELGREEDKVCICINGVCTSFDLEGNVIKE